jgi:hypothetical protein
MWEYERYRGKTGYCCVLVLRNEAEREVIVFIRKVATDQYRFHIRSLF